jgi:hypothetical protein
MPIGATRLGYWFVNNQPLPDFPNPGFEEDLVGWVVEDRRIFLNGGSTILGVPTPTDPTPFPVSDNPQFDNSTGGVSRGDGFGFNSGPIFSHQIVNDAPPITGGSKALRLNSDGSFTSSPEGAGGIFYGPVLYSTNAVIAEIGDFVEFEWRAISGGELGGISAGDAFNVFAYMVEPSTGRTLTILDENAPNLNFSTSWQKASREILPGEEGNYHFVFVCGSFDATFGRRVGSALILDNIILRKNLLDNE